MTRQGDLPQHFETPESWSWGAFDPGDGRTLRFGMNDDAQARGCVLILPGMGDFAEKYFEIVRELKQRGLSCLTLDWFDQGGSGRNLTGTTRRHSHGFDRDIKDASAFLDRIIAPRLQGRPLILLGHSMGGHLGLRLLLSRPQDFAASAFTAPMVRIQATSFLPDNGWLSLTSLMVKHYPAHFVPGGHEWTPKDRAFPAPGHTIFSSDPVRDRVHNQWVERKPELAVGSATWGWVHHALQSCLALETQAANPPACPVLLVSAGKDVFVNTPAIRALAARWPSAHELHLPKSKHEILMETDDIRMQFWESFDRLIAPVFNQSPSPKPQPEGAMNAPSEASKRLSDRIVVALELALEQQDMATCDHLVQALELSVTRGAGGAGFVEKRDFPPRIDQALERYYRMKK